MSTPTFRGRFVWYELLTTDPEAAQDFYRRIVGWGSQAWEQNPSYVMWTNGGVPLGGVMKLPEEAKAMGAPPHWLAYIATPDVDATASRTRELGGKVLHGPEDIPTVGRFAVLADPQGAVFAGFQPLGEAPEHEGPAGLGEFSWHELATTDYAAAFEFYRALFGWETTETMDMGEHGVYHMYGLKGETFGGIYNKTADMPGPSAWLYYIRVKDVRSSVEQVKELGGRVLNGPMEVPGGGSILQGLDPQGAAFALYSAAE